MRPPDSSGGASPAQESRPTSATADVAAAKPHEVRRHAPTPADVARATTPWHRLAQLERQRARVQRVRQVERAVQARRDAGDRDGVALAAAWLLAEARGAA